MDIQVCSNASFTIRKSDCSLCHFRRCLRQVFRWFQVENLLGWSVMLCARVIPLQMLVTTLGLLICTRFGRNLFLHFPYPLKNKKDIIRPHVFIGFFLEEVSLRIPSKTRCEGSSHHLPLGNSATKKNRPYFPLNPGCVIGILIMSWFIIIPTWLGSIIRIIPYIP